jgi:hypothetical protein
MRKMIKVPLLLVEETTDLLQVTDKLYHTTLYGVTIKQ